MRYLCGQLRRVMPGGRFEGSRESAERSGGVGGPAESGPYAALGSEPRGVRLVGAVLITL